MRSFIYLIFFFFTTSIFSQYKGLVVDESQQPLQDVSVRIKGTYFGTVTNQEGAFFIDFTESSSFNLEFSFLGYDTVIIPVSESSKPFFIVLKVSPLNLSEVEISYKENPANTIIREAQKVRKLKASKGQLFIADFYSRGLFRMDSVPEKFMGISIGDLEGSLDSTRSGIVYLSETKSRIFRNKKEFKEIVYASKVSGNDNGFSFNSAKDADFNFYQNTLDFGVPIASPIGVGAFSYYRFALEETFYTPENKLINKIKLTPKTATAPAFKGHIYIVEDDWELYGLDVVIEQKRMKIPGMEQMHIMQQYQYNITDQRWSLTNQILDFEFNLFVFKGSGRFSAIYSNYNFQPLFAPKTFGAAVQQFENNANKKDSLYWTKQRPIRLSQAESRDYIKKDSIQEIRNSSEYLDSIDRVKNKYKWGDLLGKEIQNSQKKTIVTYTSPLGQKSFNPVQGLLLGVGLNWTKKWDIEKKKLEWNASIDYGFSDEKWYPSFEATYLLNRIHYHQIKLRIDNELSQFDTAPAIPKLINELGTLFFKNNWARFYQRKRIGGEWQGHLFPSLFVSYSFGHEKRTQRFNRTNYSIGFPARNYQNNSPTNSNYDFDNHELIKHKISFQYRHKQKYYENPKERFYDFDLSQPRITIELEQGFASTLEKYNYLKIDLYWLQQFKLGAIGTSQLGGRAGRYLKKDRPSFADFTHFHGNQTIYRNTAFRSFQLLPYYQKSTAEDYVVAHWEHDFYKWGLGSWPVFKQLQASLFVGGNSLFVSGDKPYFEAFVGIGNIGIKKIRFIRIDYVRAFNDTFRKDGIRLGFELF